jgi:hypothetical protein
VSIATDAQYYDRTDFIARVRAAVSGDGLSRAESVHAAVSAAGAPLGWHEAEVVAEALRHRYDNLASVSFWLPVALWREQDRLAAIRQEMRKDLIIRADNDGCALVDEPVEWLYAGPEGPPLRTPPTVDVRGRTPLTSREVGALPDEFHVLIKLVGHTQRLDR